MARTESCACGKRIYLKYRSQFQRHHWPLDLCHDCGMKWAAAHRDDENERAIEAAFARAKAHNRKHMHITDADVWGNNALAGVIRRDVPCES